MPSLNASLGLAQMKQIKNFIKAKRSLYERYSKVFKNFNAVRLFKENIVKATIGYKPWY